MNRSQYKKPSINKAVKPQNKTKVVKTKSAVDIYSKSNDAIEKYRNYLEIEKNYSEEYERTGYFAAVSKPTMFTFAVDTKETGSFVL